jgi:hypothetical protein
MPNDFVYPRDDIFFEVTGLLQLVTIALIARLTYCLIQKGLQCMGRLPTTEVSDELTRSSKIDGSALARHLTIGCV